MDTLPKDPKEIQQPLQLIELMNERATSIIETLGGPDKYLEVLDEISVDKVNFQNMHASFLHNARHRRSRLFRVVFTIFVTNSIFAVKNRYLVGNSIDYDYLSGGKGSAHKWRATFSAISIHSSTDHIAF